jgi:signal transduction histidine kinase
LVGNPLARASEVTVRANVEDEGLRLTVSDNGRGGAVVGGGSGLVGLQERVEVLGRGSFEVDSPHEVGTTLIASIPIEAHRPRQRQGWIMRTWIARSRS